jgi:hypothetical protein
MLTAVMLEGDLGGALLLLAISIGLYFLPSFVGRKKRNAGAIVALNFFLGWTVIGWIVALVWATTVDPPIATAVVVAPPASVLCSACGKYSVAGSRFCASCGGAI